MSDIHIGCPNCGEEIGVDYNAHDPEPKTSSYPGSPGGVCDATVVDKGACTCPELNETTLILAVGEHVMSDDVLTVFDDNDASLDAMRDFEMEMMS